MLNNLAHAPTLFWLWMAGGGACMLIIRTGISEKRGARFKRKGQ